MFAAGSALVGYANSRGFYIQLYIFSI